MNIQFMRETNITFKTLNGPVIVSYTQRRKLSVVYSLLIHDCTTFYLM